LSSIPDRGSIPVVAPTPTPFTPDDNPDYDLLAENIEKWMQTGLSGFVVGSYGGEEFHLSSKEKIHCVEVVSQAHKGKRFVIAGIDNPSPTSALSQAEEYASAGADMIRVRIPDIPGDKSDRGVVEYFDQVVSMSPLPVIVIHQPKQAMSVNATPDEILAVTSMDNVYAYIMSLNFRWECRIPSFIHESTQLWTCNGTLLLPGAMIGAEGACLFFANWAPDICREIISLVKEGNYSEARDIQSKVSHADFIGMDKGVAALKSGLNMLGYETTVPRRPTRPLNSDEESELREAFKTAGIL